MGDQIDQSTPVDEQHRQDCARLYRDVEQFRPLAEPVFGHQQVSGARNRQEFGDALDDAEDDGLPEFRHAGVPSSSAGGYVSAS